MNNKHFHRPHTTSKVVRGRQKTLEIELLCVGLVLALGHTLSLKYFWYDRVFLADIIVHFAGGAWVALAFFTVIPFLRKQKSVKKLTLSLMLITFTIAIFWELFEFTIENRYGVNFQGPPLDTVSDIIIGTLGGTLAALYVRPRD